MVNDLVAPIVAGQADFTFGSRFKRSWRDPLNGQMPLYRWVGNRLTTAIENLVMGTGFAELHSGYKAYSRRFLEAMPYHELSDQFVFDSQMIIMAVFSRQFAIREVAIPTRYAEDSSSVNIPKSLRYVAETVWYLVRSFFGQRRIRRRIVSGLAQRSSTQYTPPQAVGNDGDGREKLAGTIAHAAEFRHEVADGAGLDDAASARVGDRDVA
jgi:hypothetical protein